MGKVVLTTGVFDILHVGHFTLLQKCKKLAGPDGEVIIGVNSDYSAEQYKSTPIYNQHERIQAIALLGIGTTTLIKSEQDIEELIDIHKVDYYVKGSEWVGKNVTGDDKCEVIFFQSSTDYHGDKFSSSEIIKKIVSNEKLKILQLTGIPTKESVLKSAEKDNLI